MARNDGFQFPASFGFTGSASTPRTTGAPQRKASGGAIRVRPGPERPMDSDIPIPPSKLGKPTAKRSDPKPSIPAGKDGALQRTINQPTQGLAKGGKAKNWIAGAVKPSHKGMLHRALHVPEEKPIPASKLAQAAKSKNPHMRRMANFAKNVKR